MSKKRKEQDITINNSPAEETTEETVQPVKEIEESYAEGIRLNMAWEEKGRNEVGNCAFNNSPDTLKKGEPYDLLVVLCAVFAAACLCVMIVSGINKGFTPSMWVLMGCYAFIIFCCLCKPLHYAVSKSVWNASLREKFPVNKGFSEVLELFPDKISVTDALGNREEIAFDSMTGIYETNNYIIFHENDSRIFASSKKKLKDNEYASEIREILDTRVKKMITETEEKEEEKPEVTDRKVKAVSEATEEITEEIPEEAVEEADVNAVKVQSVTSFADKKKKELEELESLMKEDK